MGATVKATDIVGPTAAPLNMDEVLESLGGFGKFQVLILFLILFMEIPSSFAVFIPIFIGASPKFWLCGDELVSKQDACMCEGNLTAMDPTVSVVAEWTLVCGTSWVSDTIMSLQMAGIIVGNVCVSQCSDWYGRRYSFLGIVLCLSLGSLLTAVAVNPYMYAAARFICGASFSGFLSLSGIYCMEFLTPKWRPVSSSVGPYGVAIIILGILAYFIRPWRSLVLATCVPLVAIVFIFPFVPESPRWLLRNRKIEECTKVLDRIARINGKEPISKEILSKIAESEYPMSKLPDSNGEKSEQVERFSYLEFYRGSQMRNKTLCLQGIWFAYALVYFGVSYNIKNLPGSLYLNVVFLGLMESLGYPTAFFVNMWIGRRKAMVAFMSLTAAFLVTVAVLYLTIDVAQLSLVVAILVFGSKFGTAGAKISVKTMTGEAYPTAIRVMGIGTCKMAASIGAILSPQFVYMGEFWPAVPLFSFAVISVGGSLLCFFLTETKGKTLQEQVKEKSNKV